VRIKKIIKIMPFFSAAGVTLFFNVVFYCSNDTWCWKC